ncbi:MAG: MarR family transcriptional regulator [Rhizomicrobium sp.]
MTNECPIPETAVALRRALSKLNRRLRAERHDRQTSPGKLSVLSRLYHDGPAMPGALASAEGIQPQSLTRILADLETDGLISRRQDAQDRRQHIMEITPSGRDVLYENASDKEAWLAAAIAMQLSPVERDLLQLAAQLLDRLADAPMTKPKHHGNLGAKTHS